MDNNPADVGCARYPGVAPDRLYRDPVPIVSRTDEFDNPGRIALVDRRPGADNGPIGAGTLVLPDELVAAFMEYVAPPLLTDPDRPRQARLERIVRDGDDLLYLVIAFRRLLLCVHRPGESPPPVEVLLPDGRSGVVVGVYPCWPRVYRVRLAGPADDFASEFARYVTFVPAVRTDPPS